MLYRLYSWYSWHSYTVSSWVVVVRAVNLTVKLFTGSPHATQHGYYEVNTRNLVSTGHHNQCVQTQQFSSGPPFDFCHNCHFRSYGKHVTRNNWQQHAKTKRLAMTIVNCEAQGKGRAKVGPRKVTQKSFMDGGWWMVVYLSLMFYTKFGCHPPPPSTASLLISRNWLS